MLLLALGAISVAALGAVHELDRPIPPCSVVERPSGPQPGTVEFTQRLVREAEVIVRARALRAGDGEHATHFRATRGRPG